MDAFLDQLRGCVTLAKNDLTLRMCNRPIASARVYENGSLLIGKFVGTKDAVINDLFKIYGFQFETAPSLFGGRTWQHDAKTTVTQWGESLVYRRNWP